MNYILSVIKKYNELLAQNVIINERDTIEDIVSILNEFAKQPCDDEDEFLDMETLATNLYELIIMNNQ